MDDSTTAATVTCADTRRFVGSFLLLVWLPIAVVVVLASIVVWRMSLTTSPAEIARKQHGNPALAWIGPAKLFTSIKVARLRLETPEIAIIGASRLGEFRSAMFKPYGIYNGSFTGWTFSRLTTVLDMISAARPPKVVLFNLDYLMFGSDWEQRWAANEADWPLEYNCRTLICARNGPDWNWWARELLDPGRKSGDEFTFFGLTASAQGGLSILHDGSLRYFPEIFDYKPESGLPDVRNKRSVFDIVPKATGTRMDPGQIERLKVFAQAAQRRGIRLVAVQLPFPKAAVDVLDRGVDFDENGKLRPGADMQMWREFESAGTRAMLNDLGILFADLTHLPEAANAKAFVDPLHPGEYLTLASTIEMLKDPQIRALLPEIDLAALEEAKRQAEKDGNYFDIFKDRF